MQNIILHLDMNSYFASVEQQDNLAWRGKPVGVCEHLGGIIIGASVEAKQWGIKTGTPVWEAKKLYPKIILTHTHPDRYRFYTRKMIKVVSDYTHLVEKYSIDEVFLDITRFCNIRKNVIARSASDEAIYTNSRLPRPSDAFGARNDRMADPFEEAVNIAKQIKRRMKQEVGDWLTCSIGIAENKVLAKIGSDLKKPDGIVVIIPDIVQAIGLPLKQGNALHYSADCIILSKSQLYDQLALTDIPGIGARQEHNLSELGIKTLKDLRDFPKSHLTARFGSLGGHHLYNLGQLEGSWKAAVKDDQNIKSMGHMYTLPREFRKPEFFLPVLYKLCEMVGRRLRRKELMGNIIHFYFHDKNYEGFGKSLKLSHFLQDGREIFLQAADIFESLKYPLPSPPHRGGGNGFSSPPLIGVPHSPLGGNGVILVEGVREGGMNREFKLIGVTVAGLRPYQNQLSLFGDVERQRQLVASLDKINQKYGEFTICRAPILKAGRAFRDSVGFGRMKEL